MTIEDRIRTFTLAATVLRRAASVWRRSWSAWCVGFRALDNCGLPVDPTAPEACRWCLVGMIVREVPVENVTAVTQAATEALESMRPRGTDFIALEEANDQQPSRHAAARLAELLAHRCTQIAAGMAAGEAP